MDEPAQREIDAHGVEQGERPRPALRALPRAVDDLVADIGEHGRREMTRQIGHREIAVDELVALLGDEGIGDLLRAGADLDAGAEFLGQRAQLLEKILAKEPGLRHGRRITAGRLELRPGAAGEVHCSGRLPVDAQLGIAERQSFLRRRNDARSGIARQRLAQRVAGGGMELLQAIDGLFGRQAAAFGAVRCHVTRTHRLRVHDPDRRAPACRPARFFRRSDVRRNAKPAYLHSGLGSGFEPRDAVFDAAVALLVGAVELDAVVERDAAHLEGGFALVCPCPLAGASKKPAR